MSTAEGVDCARMRRVLRPPCVDSAASGCGRLWRGGDRPEEFTWMRPWRHQSLRRPAGRRSGQGGWADEGACVVTGRGSPLVGRLRASSLRRPLPACGCKSVDRGLQRRGRRGWESSGDRGTLSYVQRCERVRTRWLRAPGTRWLRASGTRSRPPVATVNRASATLTRTRQGADVGRGVTRRGVARAPSGPARRKAEARQRHRRVMKKPTIITPKPMARFQFPRLGTGRLPLVR